MNQAATVTMTGRIVRTLEQSRRLAVERFWIDAEPAPQEPPPGWRELEVLDSRSFAGQTVGPLLLWDETVGTPDELPTLLGGYFAGNLEAWQPRPVPLEFDVRGLTPLSDDEFWPVIEEMGGRLWESRLNKASRELSTQQEEFILRWQETVAQHALRLIRTFEAADLADQFREGGGMHILGAIIGAGRTAYEYSIANPTDYVDDSISDNSFLVMWLGERALQKKLKHDAKVTSSFTAEHRRLRGPVRPSLRSSEGVSLYGVRALVEIDLKIRMRIILTAHPNMDGDARPLFREPVESFGGTVRSRIEITDHGYAYPMNCDIFTIKRRFSGTRADYVQRFVNPMTTHR